MVLLVLESIDDKLRVWRKVVEWIVYQFDYKHIYLRLLPEIHQCSKSER